jgi:hypothetical protein
MGVVLTIGMTYFLTFVISISVLSGSKLGPTLLAIHGTYRIFQATVWTQTGGNFTDLRDRSFFTLLLLRTMKKGGRVLEPGGLPAIRIATLQLGVNKAGVVDPKIMGEMIGAAGISQNSPIEDNDSVVGIKMLETVGNRDYQSVPFTGNIPEEIHDLVFGPGV